MERSLFLDELLQGLRPEQLHHDPRPIVLGDHVEHGDDRGMRDHGGGPALALGTRAQLGTQLLVENGRQPHFLDRHVPVKQLVMCPPNGAHAAPTDRLHEPIARGE